MKLRIGPARRPPALVQALGFALAVAANQPAFADDDDGAQNYRAQCALCHTLSGVSTAAGPSLKGVVWRKIADLQDFKYSGALKAQVGTWSPQRLDDFLKNTQAFAPGTDMYWTIDDAAMRRSIIRYLEARR